MDIAQVVITSVTAICTVTISVLALKENVRTRKVSFKPLLIPTRITKFVNDDNLFACNVEYPLTEEAIGEPKVVYFGVENVGKGTANNVRVMSFSSEDEDPFIFRVGANTIKIPEHIAVPFVVRVARPEDMDDYNATYVTTLRYEDIFGKAFYLSMKLWIRDNQVSILEYQDTSDPKWREYFTVVFREVESNGFFETRQIEESLNTEGHKKD